MTTARKDRPVRNWVHLSVTYTEIPGMLERPAWRGSGTMSEKLSFKLASGKTFSGQFEVKNGIVTVTTSDGRTRSAAIEDSMLDAETLAKTLLFQLREDERRAEITCYDRRRPALTKAAVRGPPRRLVLVQSPSIAVAFATAFETGNGRKPISAPPQPGCWSVAPLRPHSVQRARCRSTSLDAPAPQRMTGTAQASGE